MHYYPRNMTPDRPIAPSVAAVVPCFNAGQRLRPVLQQLGELLHRVILVDDGSTDGAIETVSDIDIELVRFEQNRGKGHALKAGMTAALNDPAVTCVACLDADGQHNPDELPNLHRAFLASEADLLIGARTFDGDRVPFRSWLGNTLTVNIVGKLLGARLADTQSGFRLSSRRFLEETLPKISGGRYEFEMEMLVRAIRGGYRVVSEPIETIYETGNPSSHFRKLEDSWRIYRTLWKVSRAKR